MTDRQVLEVAPEQFAAAVRARVPEAPPEAEPPVPCPFEALWQRPTPKGDAVVEALFAEADGEVLVRAPVGPSLGRPSARGVLCALPDERRCRAPWADPEPEPARALARGAFVFPLGPVRGDVMESAAFRLTVVGDEILALDIGLGLKPRGIVRALVGQDPAQAARVAELAAATSGVAHAISLSLAVEEAASLAPSPRTRWVRSVLAEIERVHSHLLDLAQLAGSTGLPVAQQELLGLREEVLQTAGRLTGHRYLWGVVAPGGLTRELRDADLSAAVSAVTAVAPRAEAVLSNLAATPSFLDRLAGAGALPADAAWALAPVGPVGRASGLAPDRRAAAPYDAYRELAPPDLPVETGGDSLARYRVRWRELRASLRWLAAADPPTGPAGPPSPAQSGGHRFGVGVAEGPRGRILTAVELGPDGKVAWASMATASARNWPALPPAAANRNILQDLPIIDASFALSVAGADL
jgi:formate hydrogenlyase subunit 5